MAVLKGERVLLRPGRPEDAAALIRIRNEPEVARRRWGNVIEGEVEEAFIGNATKASSSRPTGRSSARSSTGRRTTRCTAHASMDIFLATSRHGQGLGPEAIRVLARHLFEERGHHRLTIDPAANNVAAIRAYERSGFRAVGIMRSYERGPDGVWHDGLLMDMLREEFRP